MQIAKVDLAKLNEALAFAQEQMKPMSARIALQMVQASIIPEEPTTQAAEPVEGSD